jgi:glycosyltransferase involved in cell wall biosynthesis
MRLSVVFEQRFFRTPDGRVWTDGSLGHSFWTRYLAAFDGVCVVARLKAVGQRLPGWARADGEGVSFSPVPYYVGPWQYARQAGAVRRAVRAAIDPADAVILRVPSHLAALLFPALQRNQHPYAVEVLGDPGDVFAPGAVRHPLRPWFRAMFVRALRAHCRQACAAAYVTAETLQRRYPPGPRTHSVSYSDVQLEGSLARHPRPATAFGRLLTRQNAASAAGLPPCALLMVGSLEQMYKAPDVLLDAVAQCTRHRLDLRLTIVGEGRHRAELESRAARLGLGERVGFRGQLPAGEAVREELDRADLFVLPSRTEGLPRAMIEAMARGLPCIGSTVGGIPELLPPEDTVPPNDAPGLARKIREVVTDPNRMARMSARNLARAADFREEILGARRLQFYRFLRQRTEEWSRRR